ncbi:auxin-responsive protein SAUR71-like [Senna tora]|uniref:Auxin-responsive protein SAUR71-like n=1 Tax=Senna tora TaxID=362788 RepID=A0A834TQL2_9FABA|nr:auxin-responsive protein SAUR71-like [Senna tora]
MGATVSKLMGGSSSVYAYKRLEKAVLGPKGYVPICVGLDEENCMRFMVHTKAFKDASFCELLRKSEDEYGFRNEGILKVVFEVQDFEDWITKRCIKKKIMRVKSRRLRLLKRSSTIKERKGGEFMYHRPAFPPRFTYGPIPKYRNKNKSSHGDWPIGISLCNIQLANTNGARISSPFIFIVKGGC